jgi:hypothetical protein
MPYTVWSRQRLIGETDLGFHRIVDRARSGWFRPNAEGERLMPAIAATLPAMRAYLHRDAVDASGDPLVPAALLGSTLFADLAESFQHLSALELEIRREDGSVVPTSDIGLQDTRQLLELGRVAEADEDLLDWDADDELFAVEELDRESGDCANEEVELTNAAWGELVSESSLAWTPDVPEGPETERYQIHVLLIDDRSIP